MAHYVSDSGICLRVVDFSETSQIVTLFGRAHGLLPAIAKGSKRPRKSGGAISGPLDLLATGETIFVPKPHADLALLTGWEITNHRPGLRQNQKVLYQALLCAEVTLDMLQPHDPHPELFDDLSATLDMLEANADRRALLAYCLSVLHHGGFRPHFAACQVCGRAITGEKPARFYATSGVAACTGCDAPGKYVELPGNILLALSRLSTPGTLRAQPPQKPGDPAAMSTALNLLLDQIESVTDRRLKTRALLLP